MKLNWGTGIVVFLTLFIAAMISFVVFAWRQDVNLVYKNYYEKGVDYAARMEVDKRSAVFSEQIIFEMLSDSVKILFSENLASGIESGNVMFFRPSDHNKDIIYPLELKDSTFTTSKTSLTGGRYIVKITWKMGGIEYEVDKTCIVN
jgi:nitrogen fixation protein FixH